MATVTTTASSWVGPLPPPEALQHYEAIHPGLANRIVTMAEEQSAHRRGIETSVVNGNLEAQRRGQWLAFVLALAVMGFAGVLVYAGMTAPGVGLVITEIAGFVGVFLWGRKKQAEERAEKRLRS
ncbi:MAG: DUF2335 domain-containing protein [Planctomycetes bacterium]|nr:DUF2335 domain-containing protein [Planctomycetota bacterium]